MDTMLERKGKMNVRLINRSNGISKVFKILSNYKDAFEFMMQWNNKHCIDFKGYEYGGMKGVMYYIDGSARAVCDISDIDYIQNNNIKK